MIKYVSSFFWNVEQEIEADEKRNALVCEQIKKSNIKVRILKTSHQKKYLEYEQNTLCVVSIPHAYSFHTRSPCLSFCSSPRKDFTVGGDTTSTTFQYKTVYGVASVVGRCCLYTFLVI